MPRKTRKRTVKKPMPHKPTFKNWLRHTLHAKLALLLFISIFGAVGYVSLRSSSAAVENCVSFTASPTTINSGGSSTLRWSFYDDTVEIDLINNTTNSKILNDMSFGKTSHTVSPSSTTQYRLYTRDSSGNSGSCYVTVTVNVPQTPAPSVYIYANNASYSVNVAQSSALTISWSTSNATSCSASGNWSGFKALSGGENRNSDTASAGSKYYSLTCSGKGGSRSAAVSVNVAASYNTPSAPGNPRVTSKNTSTINLAWNASSLSGPGTVNYKVYRRASQFGAFQSTNNVGGATSFASNGLSSSTTYYYAVCAFNVQQPSKSERCSYVNAATNAPPGKPQPPQPPAPPPPTSNPKPPGSGGGGTAPSNPPIQGPGASPAVIDDTAPPSTPEDFIAVFDEDRGTVRLGWSPSTDDIGVANYILERSANNKDWTLLSELLDDTQYSDTTTDFLTKYYYRLAAKDEKGNKSEYTLTDVTTGSFKANVTVNDGGEITSEDGLVTVTFPSNAVPEDSQCSVSLSEEIVTAEKGYSVINGPYMVVCKTVQGDTITSFDQPVKVSVTTSSEIRERFSGLKHLVLNDVTWEAVTVENEGDVDTFDLTTANTFAVAGKQKTTPFIVKLLITLTIMTGIGAGVVGLLYWRYRLKQQGEYENYLRQIQGL